jgi:hypothetical protein
VLLLAALVLQLSPEDAVRSLIEQLASDRIEVRAEASRKLEKIGPAALPQLERAARDADSEVASRARALVERIGIRDFLTPALEAAVPGITDRLVLGEWKEVFLELAEDLRRRPEARHFPGVTTGDLSAIAGAAASRARSAGDRIDLCLAFSRLKLKAAAPAVLDYLQDENPLVRSGAVCVLRDAEARDRVGSLRPCLADASPLVRSVAAQALGSLGDREAVPGLRKLLGDESASVRWWAVRALADLQAREAAEDVSRLREDPDEPVRRIATETAEKLRRAP